MRLIRRWSAVAGVAAMTLLAGSVPASAVDGTLPGGTSISVDIGFPADGAIIPYGTEVPIAGGAAWGTASGTPSTALIYDVGVSAGTVAEVGDSDAPYMCQDPDADLVYGQVLDCEITSLLRFNEQSFTQRTVAAVGAVAAGGRTSLDSDGTGDAVAADVRPDSGIAHLTTPGADLDTTGGADIEQVLQSAFSPGFSEFTHVEATDNGSNYQDSVIEATNDAVEDAAEDKIAVLVSDADATVGNAFVTTGVDEHGTFPTEADFKAWVASVTDDKVTFITFAVGNKAHCSPTPWNNYGTLQDLADATGGRCYPVADPTQLPSFLPGVIDAQLLGLDVTIDGTWVPTSASPAPPETGATTTSWHATGSGLSPGAHTICANATRSDRGETGTVSACRTVRVDAVEAGGPYGGDESAVEGATVPVQATLNGAATFDGWTASGGPGVDAGATCTFADPAAASTTVSCTDDGTFVLSAHSLPTDTSTAQLVLANTAPAVTPAASLTSGPTIAGSVVKAGAYFEEAGRNDTHHCEVTAFGWDGDIFGMGGEITENPAGNGGICAGQRALPAGQYTIRVEVWDDDLTFGYNASAEPVQVVSLVIGSAQPDGSLTSLEGSQLVIDAGFDPPTYWPPTYKDIVWFSTNKAGDDANAYCDVVDEHTLSPTVTCNDDGEFLLSYHLTNLDDSTIDVSIPFHVTNAEPVLATPMLNTAGMVPTGSVVTVSGAFTDAGSNDIHACTALWSDGVSEAGTVSETAGDGTCAATRTLDEPGRYSATMTVDDLDGGTDTTTSTSVTAIHLVIDPGPGPGGASVGTEGTAVHPTSNAPSGASLTWSASPDPGTDAGADCTVTGASTTAPAITCTDDGSYTVTLSATFGGREASATIPMLLDDVDPAVTSLGLDKALVPINTAVTTTAEFTDAGANDRHICAVRWDDALTAMAGSINESGGVGTCTRTDSFATPGVYRVLVRVTDDEDRVATARYDYLVVYDPTAGFVTGGGRLTVPAGSYVADPSLAGTGTFGFESKYKKGATVPSGSTEFRFHEAGFTFTSNDYQWLVVSGAKAQFKGTGSVNGTSAYSFLVTVTDGQVSGGGGVDKFRIKVWETSSGATVFDNNMGGSTDLNTAPSQPIDGGNIAIHAPR